MSRASAATDVRRVGVVSTGRAGVVEGALERLHECAARRGVEVVEIEAPGEPGRGVEELLPHGPRVARRYRLQASSWPATKITSW